MAAHYHVSEAELLSHPNMALILDDETLPLYKAGHRLGREFLCSTSGWTSKHVDALKVVQFRDFPIQRLCPATSLIPYTCELAKEIQQHFSLSAEDVKASRYDAMSFTSKFYDELSILLRTNNKTPSPIIKDAFPRRQPAPMAHRSPPEHDPDTIIGRSFLSTSDGSSYSPVRSPQSNPTSKSTDLREVVTNNMIVAFLSTLSNMAYPQKNPTTTRPEFNAWPDCLKFSLMGAPLTSENDGSGWKMRYSKSEQQWVTTGGAPLITIEARKQYNRLHPLEILAQEVGEMLAVLQLKYARRGAARDLDRQAYIVSAHHTKMYISTVYVNPSYFQGCEDGHFAPNDFFVVRSSRIWDLADPPQRIEAAMAFLAVLRYTME